MWFTYLMFCVTSNALHITSCIHLNVDLIETESGVKFPIPLTHLQWNIEDIWYKLASILNHMEKTDKQSLG